jgi:hypothetical protein
VSHAIEVPENENSTDPNSAGIGSKASTLKKMYIKIPANNVWKSIRIVHATGNGKTKKRMFRGYNAPVCIFAKSGVPENDVAFHLGSVPFLNESITRFLQGIC